MADQEAVNKMLLMVAEQSIDKSSQILSKMLKTGARIQLRNVSFADISQATAAINEQNFEAVGTFIDLLGDAPFKFLFYVGIKDAFILTDMFIGQDVGTTTAFDEYTESAVQEIGNILSSAITNVFAASFQISMKPSPPTVVRDYSGCLFQEFIVDSISEENKILLIETVFHIVKSELNCHMYILPVSGSESVLGFSIGLK